MSLVRAHPRLTDEWTQVYIMLTLTFLTLSFLGIFAINPTLTTMVELNRKLKDSEYVQESLKTKIANLSSLNTEYQALDNIWPVVDRAVPNEPEAVTVFAQIQAIAKNSGVNVKELQTFTVELDNLYVKKKLFPQESSYIFTVTAVGIKNNLIQFVKQIASFDRIVAIEAINYANENPESVTVRGRIFFVL